MEVALYLSYVPDNSVFDIRLKQTHLTVKRENKRFPEMLPFFVGTNYHSLCLLSRKAQRLLTQHSLAGTERIDSPFSMECIWESYIYNLYTVILEQFSIRCDCILDIM